MTAPWRGRPGPTSVTVALAVAVVLALLAACSSSAEPRSATRAGGEAVAAPAPTTSTRPPVVAERVLLLGDSSMVDAALAIGPAFAAAGADVVVSDAAVGFGLTGIAITRLPSPWPAVWPGLVDRVQPDLTIVMMGGWDQVWIDEHGVDAYREVATLAVDVLTARGGRVLWLSMLPEEEPKRTSPNAAYAGLPAARPGQVFYLDVAPALVGPSGGHPPSFVDGTGELLRTRKVDGWHLCQDGAIRIAELANEAAVDLGLAAPAPDGWQRGRWWDDVAFTQSPACWRPGAWTGAGPDRTPPAPWPEGTYAPQR